MPTKNVACAVDILGQPTPTPSYTTFPETAVVLVNARGQVTGASDEGRSLLGLNTENQSLPPVLREMLREALSSGNTTTSREIVLESRPSMAVEVTIQCLPDATAEHRLAIIISAVRSPSDPEQELRRLHRLASAGTLSAGIAHEIKNALVAGKTFLELLLEKHEDAELVGIVRREMDRIDSLVTQMLKFSRPAKQMRAPVNVHQILELSLRLIESQFKTKSINVKRSLTAASATVLGDEQQLEQAFLNLLINSVEAMTLQGDFAIATAVTKKEGGKAAVKPAKNHAPEANSYLEIRISDNGSGIAPEYLGRLFEPFFTTKKNGSGLGLAITRAIIKEHRGEIMVESEPNAGATFRILLPLVAA